MSRSIVFVTQVIDPADPVLGFVDGWVQALRGHYEHVDVIANEIRDAPTHDGVTYTSLGKETGVGRIGRGVQYLRGLRRVIQVRRPEGVLVHMCPIYLDLGYPLVRLRGIPTVLWYAHPSITWDLRLATRLTDAVITSLPGAFPLESPKVHVIGQATVPRPPLPERSRNGEGLRVVALGRTSPSKGFDGIIRAIGLLRERGMAVHLRVAGPSTTAEERAHRAVLQRLIEDLDLSDFVELGEGVPPAEVPSILGDADVLVNNMVAGSGDKVVFEAAANGLPVIVSNPSFAELLADLAVPLQVDVGADEQIAQRLAVLAGMPHTARRELGGALRDRVEAAHSTRTWASRVAALLEQQSS